MKPRVFIASSVEGLDVAKVINLNLDHVSTNTMWTDAFQLSSVTLSALVEQTQKNDFAIFVFSPDDDTEMRGTKHSVVRDNVLFELGMFIGALGAERCFVVKPRSAQLHIPTDLLGVTLADYDETRPKAELTAALNAPCTRIEHAMSNIQVISEKNTEKESPKEQVANEIKVSPHGEAILLSCFESRDETFNLVQLRQLDPKERAYFRRGIDELSKLAFLRLLRKDIMTKELVYQMTSSGRDYILDNDLLENI
ncbi:TIR domain-containing protein [Aliivibrio logei]|uniref:CD-NTase-associated protein 12/Pycsar effector protein TIR domain-containing protein n=1 Tax=Aliivibrio logei 5S-186 TaxID=626086 RepID=A0ABX3AVZ3_ALILO|nr:nucleotide-binding protein [Aliivibrio logei]OEF16400.1 hypothetical protein A1Q5_19215 [Aliivibrio logei 5S-186]